MNPAACSVESSSDHIQPPSHPRNTRWVTVTVTLVVCSAGQTVFWLRQSDFEG